MSTSDGRGLLVAAPMGIEAALIKLAAPRLEVHRSGMGTARASEAALAIAARRPAALLVLGFCGGLDASSVPGEAVVAEAVLAAPDEGNPAERVPCVGTEVLAGALEYCGLSVRRGTVACVSRIAVGERRVQLSAAGALAVDMESVWLAPGAAHGPFAVVRIVLDSPSHELLRPALALNALRASRALGRAARALCALIDEHGVHTVFSSG
jgi:4-hydroxy-3-methylbut-2-en-1-yl diphosphate reductase